MASKRNSGDYYQTLRARFAGRADAREDARFQPPADPTDRFFGATTASAESPAPRLFDPAGVRPLADGLSRRISAKGGAETTLVAHGLRLLVGAFWLALAGWYAMVVATTDGAALGKLFAIIAGAGFAAAIFGALLTFATGKVSLKRTREEAVVLGQRLALETHSLDHALNRDGHGVDAVSADVFLKAVSFTGDSDGGAKKFSAYLKRDGAQAKNRGGAHLFLIALAATVVLAAALGFGADASGLPLADYPFALGAVLLGAGVYAGAGVIAQLFAGPWRARREARAETAAFAALQSAFSTARGVAPVDLSARLHGKAGAQNMANRSLDEKREYESAPAPDSRNRPHDSRPTFVETGFQAAPKAFRTDAFEKKFRP